jgi:hypothetical protein
VRLEGLRKPKKKFNDLLGNKTCDIQACSTVPQLTTLPRAPLQQLNGNRRFLHCGTHLYGRTLASCQHNFSRDPEPMHTTTPKVRLTTKRPTPGGYCPVSLITRLTSHFRLDIKSSYNSLREDGKINSQREYTQSTHNFSTWSTFHTKRSLSSS